MKKITVENITDGMVLAREVCGSGGNTLLTNGITLSGALGRRLQNWGILAVFVEGEEEAAQQENAIAVSPEALMKHLTEKFGKTLQNPTMKKILDAVYRYQISKATR